LIFDTHIGAAIGCAGVREFEDGVGELKRMYIKDAYRGKGLGKTLLNQALSVAQALGYKKLRLDTVSSMKSAISLYESAGFYEIAPYRFNPNADAKYFEITFT
jgi:ribosomal protein S18 acetylase RimI-like enzyme